MSALSLVKNVAPAQSPGLAAQRCEQELAHQVRAIAKKMHPSEALAHNAIDHAVASYREGATFARALSDGVEFVQSWCARMRADQAARKPPGAWIESGWVIGGWAVLCLALLYARSQGWMP